MLSLEEKAMLRVGSVAAIMVLWLLPANWLAADEKIDVKALEKTVDRALKAYNDGDSKKFWSEFASRVDALKTKETFDALYTNGYKVMLGKFVARGSLVKEKSVLEGERGAVIWESQFEKSKKVRIEVNWEIESKEIKLIQMQFRQAE
jgi:hypothetical protein